MNISITYLAYLAISIGFTVWVARTLHRRGRIFLVDRFHGNEGVADAVNHLLVVGFYLINIGYVSIVLRYGTKPTNLAESIEFLSTKVGFVLIALAAMHFFNLVLFTRLGARRSTVPPVLGVNPFRTHSNSPLG